MSFKFLANPSINNALVWAALMIAGSWLVRDSGHAHDLLMINVGGFVATSSLIGRLEKALKAAKSAGRGAASADGVRTC